MIISLVNSTLFSRKNFESVSGHLLTSDSNRFAEIVHEKLVEALNTFFTTKAIKSRRQERLD